MSAVTKLTQSERRTHLERLAAEIVRLREPTDFVTSGSAEFASEPDANGFADYIRIRYGAGLVTVTEFPKTDRNARCWLVEWDVREVSRETEPA